MLVPTRVGMIGTTDPNVCGVKPCPHTRGDDPVEELPLTVL